MTTDLVPVRRALVSVSDKTDLVPFARALVALGAEIISTGGTARSLAEAGVPVTPIDKLTGFPEIMGGRVKTLHPMVHGGLLAVRDDAEHAAAMKAHGIRPIDLVCINLYPFEQTIRDPSAPFSEAVEQIDIGGPSMIRSGAKNFAWVAVVTSPSRYDRVVGELTANKGCTTRRLRAVLAAEAFGRTAEYDGAIASYLGRAAGMAGEGAFPPVLRLGYVKGDDLRYGENPHQRAALYRDPASTGPTVVNATQLHGKELSYNNINDGAAALEIVKALRRVDTGAAHAAIVKHTNPCGCASAGTLVDAVSRALEGDPLAAYGGILASSRPIDSPTAERLCAGELFLEVIVAPEFEPAALEKLKQRWANVRLLAVGDRAASAARKLEYRSVPGGMLVQDRDLLPADPATWKHAAGPKPTAEQLRAAGFMETVVRFVSSNAIAIGGPGAGGSLALFGAGSGQMDRVTSCRLAVEKAGPRARGAVAAGDAFFPFADGPKVLIDAGVSVIVHPGGSKRDAETLELCEKRGVTCLVTGVRHFRH